jgi:hypothetical protein
VASSHVCCDQEYFVNQISLMATAIFSSLVSIVFAPTSALAQAAVTDPGAPVPPVVYQSVFNQSPKGVETKSVDWKKANADVGQFKRGHVDILKWEESQAKDKPMSKPAMPSEASPVKAAPSPAQAVPTPHKH